MANSPATMDKPLFLYDDYKEFFSAFIESRPQKGRGLKARLAEAMNCQAAYVSHVLSGPQNFSLEQGEAAARLFSMRSEETEFLLLLIEFGRASTPQLRAFLKRQIQSRREVFLQLKSRVHAEPGISKKDEYLYYSTWRYQAVRMALTIPSLRRPEAIAERLNLSLEQVNDILRFFIEKGLATEKRGIFETTVKQIHLGSDSPHIGRHHSNWRLASLQRLERIQRSDLHYSGAVSLSIEDFEKVREIFAQALLKAQQVITKSPEEKLCALNIDFYEV